MNVFTEMFCKIKKDSYLKNLILICLVLKVCFFLIPIVVFHFLPPQGGNNFQQETFSLQDSYITWDAFHYLTVAQRGYIPNDKTNTFYPLFPFLIKTFKFIFFNNLILSGIILSNIFSFVAVIVFYLFVKKLIDEKTAFYSCIFLLAFPSSFYLCRIYTESLFLMLTFIFFYSLYYNKFIPALISSMLLPLTRPQGILISVPLVIFLLFKNLEYKKFKYFKEYFLCVSLGLGFFIYLGIMKYYTGSFWAGFDAQKFYVAKNSINNLFYPVDWFNKNFIDINLHFHDFTSSIIDRTFFLLVLIPLFYVYKNFDKTLFFYALVMIFVPALGGSFFAYTRYLLLVFPVFMLLGLKLQENHYLLTIPMFCLQIIFMTAHCLNYWVA